jgi:hypothetical protein
MARCAAARGGTVTPTAAVTAAVTVTAAVWNRSRHEARGGDEQDDHEIGRAPALD